MDGAMEERPRFTRFPVVSLSAEYLVMGHLMRRNILAYKAPPNHEGYDLICIHPDPRHVGAQVRVQVKSRFATDHDRGFPLRATSLDAFDFVVVAFLNIGFYMKKARDGSARAGARPPEYYTLPAAFAREHHRVAGGWERVLTRGLDLTPYRDDAGFELIASMLGIPYPEKVDGPANPRLQRTALARRR
jgi:hypothetical protein